MGNRRNNRAAVHRCLQLLRFLQLFIQMEQIRFNIFSFSQGFQPFNADDHLVLRLDQFLPAVQGNVKCINLLPSALRLLIFSGAGYRILYFF